MLAVFAVHMIRLQNLLPKKHSDFPVCSWQWPSVVDMSYQLVTELTRAQKILPGYAGSFSG